MRRIASFVGVWGCIGWSVILSSTASVFAAPNDFTTPTSGGGSAPNVEAAGAVAPPPVAEPVAPAQSGVSQGNSSDGVDKVIVPAAQPGADSARAIEELVARQPEWGCQYVAHAITEQHVLIACGGGLVLTLARTATGVQLIGRRQVEGRAAEFYEHEGAVWVRVVSETAQSVIPGAILASGKAAVPVAQAPLAVPTLAPPLPETLEGTVSRIDGRDVVVDMPAQHRLKEGDRLALSKPALDTESLATDEPIVARVVRVMDNQVIVHLGLNEVVEVGFQAQTTRERETASRRSPPRVFDVWDLRTVLRPVLNIGSVGGGVIGELGLSHRTQHFRFGVNLSPLAFAGASKEGSQWVSGGYVFGAVDHAIYSAGVGVGADTVRDTDGLSDAGSGLSIVQLLRIGAIDGLHLASRVEAVVFRSEVLFGYLQIEGQVAVGDAIWLVVRGGGGRIGYGFGEVVVRNMLWGTGQAGSTFLELGLGGAGVFQNTCPPTAPVITEVEFPHCTDRTFGGPMFTAGVEWRL